jgi:hypothetical protein
MEIHGVCNSLAVWSAGIQTSFCRDSRDLRVSRVLVAALSVMISISLNAAQGKPQPKAQTETQCKQELGSLDLIVTDPTGAVVGNAKVTLIAPDGRRTTSLTNSVGQAHFSGLTPGNYTIIVARQHFNENSQRIEVQKRAPTAMSMILSLKTYWEEDWMAQPVLVPTIDPSPGSELTPYKILPVKTAKKHR